MRWQAGVARGQIAPEAEGGEERGHEGAVMEQEGQGGAQRLRGASRMPKLRLNHSKALLERLEAKAEEEAKNSPSRKPLADTHVSRDVKECKHCGITKGRRLYNRDNVGGHGIGFRTFVQKVCGLPCPGHFHPAEVVLRTSCAKNAATNAALEAEKYVKDAFRLIKAEREAWEALHGQRASHPRIEDAEASLIDAEETFEDIKTSTTWLVELNKDHHRAYADVVKAAEMKFEGSSWKDNRMRNDASYRKKVFQKAKQTSEQTVNDRLLEEKECPSRVDRVVYTAEKRKASIVNKTARVKVLLHDVATSLNRVRCRNGKDAGYRFDRKTRVKKDVSPTVGRREGMVTR